MRGKNIIWLSLMAVLLMPLMMIDVGTAPTNTKIYIDPGTIPTHPSDLGHPGDVFDMAVKIDNVQNLWSVAFKVKYAPFGRPLVVGEVKEGDFLKQEGWPTSFVTKISVLNGELSVGITRYWVYGMPWPPVGASGDGILCTFKFSVVEAGDSAIDLTNVLMLDAGLNPITHQAIGGIYQGTTANLIGIEFPDGRNAYVGGSLRVLSYAKSSSDVALITRTRFDLERLEDGRRIKIYAGQNYAGGGLGEPNPSQYFYVNEYIYNLPGMPGGMDIVDDGTWSNPASVVGLPDGNYAECSTPFGWTGWYGFQDMTLAGREILNIDLQGYTAQPDDVSWDIDPYVAIWRPDGTFYRYRWCDSFGGYASWKWNGGRYYGGDPTYDMPEYYDPNRYLYTEYGFNRATVFLENYCYDSSRQRIDAMRWYVEFSPITPVATPDYDIDPGASIAFDAFTINAITEEMMGTYVLTATLEYSLGGANWIEGAKTRTVTFRIKP